MVMSLYYITNALSIKKTKKMKNFLKKMKKFLHLSTSRARVTHALYIKVYNHVENMSKKITFLKLKSVRNGKRKYRSKNDILKS